MIQMLANTAASGLDGLYVSVGAITALGIAVVAVVKAYRSGVNHGKESNDVTIKKPVPTIRTQEKPEYVPRHDFDLHLGRFDNHVRKSSDNVRDLHERINIIGTALGHMQGKVESTDKNVEKLLDLALNKKSTI